MDTFDKKHNRLFIFIILTVFFNYIIFIVRFHKNVVYCAFNPFRTPAVFTCSAVAFTGPFPANLTLKTTLPVVQGYSGKQHDVFFLFTKVRDKL